MNRSFFLCLAACRTRSSAWVTRSRFCARSVLCWPAFPSVPALRSTGSSTGRPASFVGFGATMAGSDFSRPCIIGFGSSPSRCGPGRLRRRRPDVRSPRFRRDPFVRDGVFDHGRATAPRIAAPHMLPSTFPTVSASAIFWLSRLNTHPTRSLCTLRGRRRRRPRNTRYQAGATPYLGRSSTGWIAPASPGAPHPDCRATALVDRIDAAVPRVSDTHPAPAGPADEHALQEAKTLSGRRGQHLGVGSIGAEAGAIGGELLPVDVTLVVVGDHHAPGFLGVRRDLTVISPVGPTSLDD